MSQVYENLWIGPANVAREKDFLLDTNITVIVNCAEEESINRYPLLSSLFTVHVPLIDDEEPHAREMILKGAEFIQIYLQQGKNLLVHCKAGISRSATVILAWMIIYKNIPFDTAYRFLQEKRPIIRPNDFYIQLLKGLEKDFYVAIKE